MQSQNITDIEATLYWDVPDYPRLGAFVQSTLIAFMGDEHHFNGTSKWNGTPAMRKSYGLLSDWRASLLDLPDEINISLSSNNPNRHLYLRFYGANLLGNITITVPDAEVEEAKRLIKEMSQALQLSFKQDGTEKRVGLERSYRTSQSIGLEWFSSFIDSLEELIGKVTRISCRYKLSESPGYSYTYEQFTDWKRGVFENWGKISQVSCSLSKMEENINVDWHLERNEFRLSVESSKKERVDSLIDTLEKQANLSVFIGNSYIQPLVGEQNTYFTECPINWEWFEGSVTELWKYFANEITYSDFSASKISEQSKPMTWQDKESWLVFIRENWANISQAYCYISNNKLNLTFNCEPIHDWVSLRIRAATHSRVLEITQDLQEKLELQPIEGVSYGPVRSSGYYSISKWSNLGFAKAVEQAVSQFQKYSLTEALVIEEEGKGERKHNTFHDLPSFLKRLSQGKGYIEAHIQIKGSRGAQMGVHVLNKCTRLELKSHLSLSKFPELVQLFDDELDLDKIAETKEQAESKNKSFKDSVWVLIFLPVFMAVLTSTLLSDQFRTAAIPKYSLQVVNPRSENGKPIVLTTQPFEVYWKLQSERWFKKRIDLNSPVSYRIFGKDSLIKHEENAYPGMKLNLPPGTYQMEITSVLSGEQSSITFTINGGESKNKLPQ